jgi:hypothetical protein
MSLFATAQMIKGVVAQNDQRVDGSCIALELDLLIPGPLVCME